MKAATVTYGEIGMPPNLVRCEHKTYLVEIAIPTMFNFRLRNPARDAETDTWRRQRLAKVVQQISLEIESELDGLKRRYDEATMNAAFLVEAVENGAALKRTSIRVRELTSSILQCERRMSLLKQHQGLIRQLHELLRTYT